MWAEPSSRLGIQMDWKSRRGNLSLVFNPFWVGTPLPLDIRLQVLHTLCADLYQHLFRGLTGLWLQTWVTSLPSFLFRVGYCSLLVCLLWRTWTNTKGDHFCPLTFCLVLWLAWAKEMLADVIEAEHRREFRWQNYSTLVSLPSPWDHV
jgi:hypothetical protein